MEKKGGEKRDGEKGDGEKGVRKRGRQVRRLKGGVRPCPGPGVLPLGHDVVNFDEISQPVREPLPAPVTEVRHDVLYEAVFIFLLVRQQLQRINQISTKALAHCMPSEDLGLTDTFACLHHQEPVWCPPIIFSPQIAHHQFVCFFSPESHQRSLPSGNCYNAGTTMTSWRLLASPLAR